jgi:hypothetical protein
MYYRAGRGYVVAYRDDAGEVVEVADGDGLDERVLHFWGGVPAAGLELVVHADELEDAEVVDGGDPEDARWAGPTPSLVCARALAGDCGEEGREGRGGRRG